MQFRLNVAIPKIAHGGAALLLLALAGCAKPVVTPVPGSPAAPRPIDLSAHVPDFARTPYEPFSREDAVAIALREWRLFGQPIDDDPPDSRPPPLPQDKPERQAGLWERVGEYWWLGQNADRRESGWTGKHDEYGIVFPASQDGGYAWSAAFISYVMRIDGAGARFPYSPSHSTYINAALANNGWVVTAHPIDQYAPQLGDLICASRGRRRIRFEDLPASFPAHCEIVTAIAPGVISAISGNVDDAVTLTHIPVTADGRLGTVSDQPLDTRYPWFVVLQVLYDR
jgi:hypothetical protein